MKRVLLICVCSFCLLSSSAEALRFGPAPTITVPTQKMVQFLPSRNEALEKAVEAHNLMTQLPVLRTMIEQQDKLTEATKKMQKLTKNLLDCNTRRFGRYKNASDVLKKVRAAYKDKTKDLHDEEGYYSEDSIVPRSLAERSYLWDKKRSIEQDIMKDALKNPKKWGGQLVDRRVGGVPDDLGRKMAGTGLEELMIAEEGTGNAVTAEQDFKQTYEKMKADFLKRVASLGVDMSTLNEQNAGFVNQLRKILKDFRAQKLEEAKIYVEKLKEQDTKYPDAVARRTARLKNTQEVTQKVLQQFPEAFSGAQSFDQQAPQERQEMLIAAIEKDVNATVYLTETNALEVDQKIVEAKANAALVKRLETQRDDMMPNQEALSKDIDFDFSVCS